MTKLTMVFEKDEYRIMDDGIWISRKTLEECRDHYNKVSLGCDRNRNMLQAWLYMGKRDVYVDMLKMFEPLEL